MSLFKKKIGPVPDKTASGFFSGLEQTLSFAEIVLNNISEAIIVIDGNAQIKYLNLAAVRFFNLPNTNSATGIDIMYFLKLQNSNNDTISDDDNLLIKSIKQNTSFESREFRFFNQATKKRVCIYISLIPIDSQNQDKIITIRDITKEIEDEEEKSEFVSTASHEMRTPIASIEGYLGLALNPQTASIDERARGYLDAAHKASQHLGELFKNLLDSAKFDENHFKSNPTPLDISVFLDEFYKNTAELAREKNLNYFYGANHEKNTKSLVIRQPIYVYVDRLLLNEILTNLISNAIKYTPNGGQIKLSYFLKDDNVILTVSDTGIGISSEDIRHIFQKFYRADNSQTREIGGTGLGLYISKKYTETMSGMIWVESTLGKGSTFFVSFPTISVDEYNKRMIAVQNSQLMQSNNVP